jgi:hypothetical protein
MRREEQPNLDGKHQRHDGAVNSHPSLEEQQEQVLRVMQEIREERQQAGRPVPPDVSLMAEAHRRIAGIEPGDDLGVDRASGVVPIERPEIPKIPGQGI